MTYWSSANLIWRGLGSFAACGRVFGCSSISSSMISWQRLMHSSQMYTPCPAISFRTCSWLLPQNEQRYGTLGPLVLPVAVTDAVLSLPSSPLLLGLLRCRPVLADACRLGHRRALAARQPGVVRLRDQRLPRERVDGVDDAIVLGFLGRHEKVPVGVPLDLLQRLAGVLREDLVVALDEELPFLHLDDRIRGVAAEPPRALVDHHPAVRQRVPLALRPGGEEDGGHRGRHADADRADRRAQVLHRVVD